MRSAPNIITDTIILKATPLRPNRLLPSYLPVRFPLGLSLSGSVEVSDREEQRQQPFLRVVFERAWTLTQSQQVPVTCLHAFRPMRVYTHAHIHTHTHTHTHTTRPHNPQHRCCRSICRPAAESHALTLEGTAGQGQR